MGDKEIGVHKHMKRKIDFHILTSKLGMPIHPEDPLTLFEMQEKLGKGSYGSVYKARNINTSEIVAIKMIALDEGETIKDVRREIAILSECDDPHVVKYFGSYYRDETLWVCCVTYFTFTFIIFIYFCIKS